MNYPYLAIFGRGLINKFKAVVHQLYLCMKMPASRGIITVRGDQQLARDIERGVAPGQRNIHVLEAQKTTTSGKISKEKVTFDEGYEVKRVPLDKHLLDKVVTISATLSEEEEKELLDFLNKNKDVFAWSASDLRGVSKNIVEHRLDSRPGVKPKKQKPQKMSDEIVFS